jgi:hypothetical protein
VLNIDQCWTGSRLGREAGRLRNLKCGGNDAAGCPMRKPLGGRCSSDPVSSLALQLMVPDVQVPSSVLQPQYRHLTAERKVAPLAQSVERIHGKENSGAILLVR